MRVTVLVADVVRLTVTLAENEGFEVAVSLAAGVPVRLAPNDGD